MPVAQQRASVIYVAGSARELPAEVQDWLGRAETRAVASPHIYDMLAQLARGKRFAAIIVNVQSVDWTEMEFFEHAARLSGHTPVYVTGTHQQRAKLDAACRRGARRFDALALQEDLSPGVDSFEMPQAAEPWPPDGSPAAPDSPPAPEPPEAEPPRSMAVQPGSGWPRVHLVDELELSVPEPSDAPPAEAIETGFIDEEPGEVSAAADEAPKAPSHGTGTPEGTEEPCPPSEEIAPVPTAERPATAGHETPWPADALEPGGDQASGADARPTVRLVAVDEPAPSDPPVMFPWSENPNRPKRTPPPSTALPAPQAPPAAASNSSESPFKSVRLTAEEIAALMGSPPHRRGPEAQS